MNAIVQLLGLGWIWDKLDGIKTYLAGGLAILTGLGGVLLALSGIGAELLPLLSAHNLAGILELVKNFATDPNAIALGKAWLVLISGLGILGIGHKIDKAAAAAAPIAVSAQPPISAPAAAPVSPKNPQTPGGPSNA